LTVYPKYLKDNLTRSDKIYDSVPLGMIQKLMLEIEFSRPLTRYLFLNFSTEK